MTKETAPDPQIEILIKVAGNQEKLAAALGCTQSSISQWLNGHTRIGPKWVLEAERHFGVPRHQLRPDIYPREVTTDLGVEDRFCAVDRRLSSLRGPIPAASAGAVS